MRSAHITLLGAILLTLTACGGGQDEGAAAQQGPPPAMPVTVAKPVQQQLVEWDRFVGRLEACDSVEIRARVSGYLESVHFTEGEIVEKGDLLFVIDRRPYEAEVAQAEAEVGRRRAELKVSMASEKEATARLAAVKARKSQLESQRSLAQKRLERAQRAAKTDAIAAEQLDVRTSELSQAQAAIEGVDADIAAAEAAIATAQASVVTSKAAITTAEAALESAKIDLGFCRIEAPIGGRIGREFVNVGNLVMGGAGGSTLLTTIVSIDPIHCYFEATEQQMLRYLRLDRNGGRESSRKVKNPVYIALVDEEGYPHRGHMDFVDNRVDTGTGTIRSRAIFRNPDGLLVPGAFAILRLPGTAPRDCLLLPETAILADQADRFVWVSVGDGQVQRRSLELGPKIDGMRIIRSGITADDLVVVNGLQRIRPGAPVAPQETKLEKIERTDGLPNDYVPVPESEWIHSPNGEDDAR